KYRECMAALMEGDQPERRIEIEFRRDETESIQVEIGAVRFDWMGEPFAQVVIHDIRWRKQAEAERDRLHQEIETERNRLWQILEQMPIGVTIAEAPSGRLIFHNREAEWLLRHAIPETDDYKGYAKFGALRNVGDRCEAEEYPMSR